MNSQILIAVPFINTPPPTHTHLAYTRSIKREASVSPDVQKNLAPYAKTLTHSKDRVFKDGDVSQTADVEHLQDFEKDVKALIQETLWFLNMHKVSSENERSVREAVNAVESKMRRVLTIDLSTCVSMVLYMQHCILH